MKKLFTSVLLFVACFSAKAQFVNYDIFDFDAADTFYYYDWLGGHSAEGTDTRLVIDTVNYKRNQWQIGKPQKHIFDSAYTLPNAIVTDTSLPCISNDTSVFLLKLPYTVSPYGLPLFYLSFLYKLDIDSGDIALVEASIDSCQTWTNILIDTTSIWRVYPKPDLSVSTSGWDSIAVFPSEWMTIPNDTLYVRFTFITGSDTAARDGWMIDHIIAQHQVEGVTNIANDNTFQVYPNPTIEKTELKFTKALKANCEMIVLDALGRQVFWDRLNKGSTDYTLSVQDWVKGIYFIELNDGKGNRTTQKLMVE